MILRDNSVRAGILVWWLVLGLSALAGCSKAPPPSAVVVVSVTSAATNGNGEVLVQLSITNKSARALLMGVRSAVYRTGDTWVTNFATRPRFVGMSGPGSESSDVSLAAGAGITAALSPVRVALPFRLEFVCFPSRRGVAGVVDQTRNKVEQFRDGSEHERYLGESFFVLSPVISLGTEPNGPANRSQPVGPETNRTSAAAGSGG